MSSLLYVTQPTGTLTVGQSASYTFALGGPYPVSYTFSQWNTLKSGTANDNLPITISATVPASPNQTTGSLVFSGPSESTFTYLLAPINGFSMTLYPVMNTQDTYSTWVKNRYGNTKLVTSGSTVLFSLDISGQGTGAPTTDASFPATITLTSQQVYPTLGAETTVYTQTFNTRALFSAQSYTTPAIINNTINRYKLYTTNPSATSFTADTNTTMASCIPISKTQAPFIYVQPVNTTIPNALGGIQYNATVIGLNFISAVASPTITWYRNGSPVPGSWVVQVPNYNGFDTSISVQTSQTINGDTFYCVISDANGTATSSTATLTVNAPIVADAVTVSAAAVSATTLLSGSTFTIAANATANGPVTYQWKKNGASILGANGSTYSTNVALVDNGSSYTVTAQSGTASSTSSPITLGVYVKSTAFPVNLPITWTALASTVGSPNATFYYAWSFNDGVVLTGKSVSKTIFSVGPTIATVTATDVTTGGTASASKTVTSTNWANKVWVTTTRSILPTGSAVSDTSARPLIVSGNYLINVGDYYAPNVVVVYDAVGDIVSQYSNATLGNIGNGCVLTTGPNAGKLLLVGISSGKYAFMDIATGTFTIGTSALPNPTPSLSGTTHPPFEYMGNGKLFYSSFGYNGFTYVNQSMTYDPIADTWADAKTWTGIPSTGGLRFFKLPSGKLLLETNSAPYLYVFDYNTSSVSNGPPSTTVESASYYTIEQLADLSFVGTTTGASPVMAYWKEGQSDWVNYTSKYPVSSQAGYAQSVYQAWVVTPDGFLVNVAGSTTSGTSAPNTKTVFYNAYGDGYILGPGLPNSGYTMIKGFGGGKIWIENGAGLLCYMVW